MSDQSPRQLYAVPDLERRNDTPFTSGDRLDLHSSDLPREVKSPEVIRAMGEVANVFEAIEHAPIEKTPPPADYAVTGINYNVYTDITPELIAIRSAAIARARYDEIHESAA